jgi:hypothetical protein
MSGVQNLFQLYFFCLFYLKYYSISFKSCMLFSSIFSFLFFINNTNSRFFFCYCNNVVLIIKEKYLSKEKLKFIFNLNIKLKTFLLLNKKKLGCIFCVKGRRKGENLVEARHF